MAETVVLWMWRHGSVSPGVADSLDDAVASSFWIEQYGEGSTGCVEIITDGMSTIYDKDQIREMWTPLEEEQEAEWKEQPTPVALMDVRSPEGKWGCYTSCYDEAEVATKQAELSAIFGAVRVRVRDYGRALPRDTVPR